MTDRYAEATSAGHLRTDVGSIVVMINKYDRDRNVHYHGCMLPDDVPKQWYEQAVARRPGFPQPSLQMM